jgi:hypothetical protein
MRTNRCSSPLRKSTAPGPEQHLMFRRSNYLTFPSTTHALIPPKPKELLMM